MIKLLLILGLAFISANTYAKDLLTVESTKNKCAQGAQLFGENQVKDSFYALAKYWPLPQAEIDNLVYQTNSQLGMVASRFGDILGSDYIKSEVAGDSFVKHTFTIKFEKHAIRYLCVFYKPKNKWLVNSIKWDDTIDLIF